MKHKNKIIGCALLGAVAGVCVLGGCAAAKYTINPTNEKYVPDFELDRELHAIDEQIKIDGVLDEAVWKKDGGTQRWYKGRKDYGGEWADIELTTWFGEQGIYIAFEITEAAGTIHYSPSRASYINSGIEMYLALESASTIVSPASYEIDMQCSGKLGIGHSRGGKWTTAETTNENAPQYTATTKDGAYNSETCTGYIGELFMPYDYFVADGAINEGEPINVVYINPVLITSYSDTGDNVNTDRHWFNVAKMDTDGTGWDIPRDNFHFNKDGLVSYDININDAQGGAVTHPKNYDFALANNSLRLNVDAEDGYTLKSLTVNGEDYKDKIMFENNNAAYISLPPVTGDVNVNAEFKPFSAEKRVVSGNITPKNCPELAENLSDIQVLYFDGFSYIKVKTTDGRYEGSVPVDAGELILKSKVEGYIIARHAIAAGSAAIENNFTVDASMYGSKRTISDSGATIYGGEKTVELSGEIAADGMVASFWYGLPGPGKISDNITSDSAGNYVSNFYLQGDNAYVRLQLIKWGGNYSFKVLIEGSKDRSIPINNEAVKTKLIRDNGLHLYIEGKGNTWTFYADVDGIAIKLSSISVGKLFNTTKISSYKLEGAEGVNSNWGVKVSDLVFYQGTTLEELGIYAE